MYIKPNESISKSSTYTIEKTKPKKNKKITDKKRVQMEANPMYQCFGSAAINA